MMLDSDAMNLRSEVDEYVSDNDCKDEVHYNSRERHFWDFTVITTYTEAYRDTVFYTYGIHPLASSMEAIKLGLDNAWSETRDQGFELELSVYIVLAFGSRALGNLSDARNYLVKALEVVAGNSLEEAHVATSESLLSLAHFVWHNDYANVMDPHSFGWNLYSEAEKIIVKTGRYNSVARIRIDLLMMLWEPMKSQMYLKRVLATLQEGMDYYVWDENQTKDIEASQRIIQTLNAYYYFTAYLHFFIAINYIFTPPLDPMNPLPSLIRTVNTPEHTTFLFEAEKEWTRVNKEIEQYYTQKERDKDSIYSYLHTNMLAAKVGIKGPMGLNRPVEEVLEPLDSFLQYMYQMRLNRFFPGVIQRSVMIVVRTCVSLGDQERANQVLDLMQSVTGSTPSMETFCRVAKQMVAQIKNSPTPEVDVKQEKQMKEYVKAIDINKGRYVTNVWRAVKRKKGKKKPLVSDF